MKGKQIHIRVTDEEYNFIKERSKKANLTMTDFIMKSVGNKKIVVISSYREVFDEIRKIGININQIAKNWNMGLGEKRDIDDIQKFMVEIWRLLRYSKQEII